MTEALPSLDLTLFRWLTPWHSAWLDQVMSSTSASGTASAAWLVLAVIALTNARTRAAAFRVLLAVALSYLLVDSILKPLIARPRPQSILATAPPRALPPMPRSQSFPSGHATAGFASAVTVSRMWPQTTAVWWTLAILIGYSRIYLGHHYPLDVAAGAVFGVLIAFWVLGGKNPATYMKTLKMPPGEVVRP
jgi:undecaprenyl-diphosphatase